MSIRGNLPRSSSDEVATDHNAVDEAVDEFFDSVMSEAPVAGATHTFYRYPARFSPQFARAAIAAFSSPGDTVFDPFVGGGTTAIESQLAGRRFVGTDINPLAVFVSRIKTTPLTKSDAKRLSTWADSLYRKVNLHQPNRRHSEWEKYQRNVPWWLRKTLEISLDGIQSLESQRIRDFARATLLRTAQWALDCRSEIPSSDEFLIKHAQHVEEMIASAISFGDQIDKVFSGKLRNRRIICRSAEGVESDRRIPSEWLPPRLVLTSPPYIGIHVLYHRWQIQGRRETPAAYWLADCLDGHGAGHYTFGDRKRTDPEVYISHVRRAFGSVVKMLDKESLVVQMVAFANPTEHLPIYLEALKSVGLTEVPADGIGHSAERLWRRVPNRKWYTREDRTERREVVLLHRKGN